MRAIFFAFLAVLCCSACSATTIIVVRHAEREPITATNNDPPLTAAGRQRALALLDSVRNAGISAVITTQLQRTHQTAQPAAEAAGVTPVIVTINPNAAQENADAVLAEINRQQNRSILVVGHSNTVPLIISGLGFTPPPAIAEDDFGNLFVIELVKQQNSIRRRLVRARYGD